MIEAKASCSHLKVERWQLFVDVGHCLGEGWRCSDCGKQFSPAIQAPDTPPSATITSLYTQAELDQAVREAVAENTEGWKRMYAAQIEYGVACSDRARAEGAAWMREACAQYVKSCREQIDNVVQVFDVLADHIRTISYAAADAALERIRREARIETYESMAARDWKANSDVAITCKVLAQDEHDALKERDTGEAVARECEKWQHACGLKTPEELAKLLSRAHKQAISERDGEWIDAIEDVIHVGIFPETIEQAMVDLKGEIECIRQEVVACLRDAIAARFAAREPYSGAWTQQWKIVDEAVRMWTDQWAQDERDALKDSE